jgi:hypothetical protein
LRTCELLSTTQSDGVFGFLIFLALEDFLTLALVVAVPLVLVVASTDDQTQPSWQGSTIWVLETGG